MIDACRGLTGTGVTTGRGYLPGQCNLRGRGIYEGGIDIYLGSRFGVCGVCGARDRTVTVTVQDADVEGELRHGASTPGRFGPSVRFT